MQLTVTLGNVETKTTTKGANAGQKYTTIRNSTAHFAKGDKQITVMAFGAQRESVLSLLRKGKKITVTAVWDGNGVMKILAPRDEAAPAEAA